MRQKLNSDIADPISGSVSKSLLKIKDSSILLNMVVQEVAIESPQNILFLIDGWTTIPKIIKRKVVKSNHDYHH